LYKARERRNPYEFDYQQYLIEHGINGAFKIDSIGSIVIKAASKDYLESMIFDIRKTIDDKILLLHSKECAALLRGLLLADRNEIGEDVQSDFINTGVIHILAVSGSNVLMVIILLSFLTGRLGIYKRHIILFIGLVIFLVITGTSASVLRAVIMAVTVLIANLLNRSWNIYNVVFLSILVILIYNPLQLFDSGFQLSYSAVFSIIYINPKLNSALIKIFPRNSHSRKLSVIQTFFTFVLITISAQIGTLPFTLFYFGKLSLVSLIANMVIIPVIAVITGSAIFSILISNFWMFGAGIYAGANNYLTHLIYSIAHFLGNQKYSFLAINNFTLYDSLVFYLSLVSLIYFLKLFTKNRNKLIFSAILISAAYSISRLDDNTLLPEGRLSITGIDVGQGDATLLKLPDGKIALIDAGAANLKFDSGEKVIIPLLNRLGINNIDYAIITHIDNDHYAGFISMISNGKIKLVYKPAIDSMNIKDLKIEKFLREMNVPVKYFTREIIKLYNSRIYLFNDSLRSNSKNLSQNDRSGIIKVVYGKTSILFTGDAGYKRESELAELYGSNIKADILKLGHHGSKYSSSYQFLCLVKPKYALISAGIQNRYNHPSAYVIGKLRYLRIEPLRTDSSGAVILVSDGEHIKVQDWENN
ncbi:MAG: DNA internalization-related competence protein ComEC/Rec2, partial [Bacillota bacterium]